MALYNDRRGGSKLYDIGMNAPPTHDPSQGLHGWASTADDAARGRAATMSPAPVSRAANILPGMMNAPRVPMAKASPYDAVPSITSPAQQRASARPMSAPSRVQSWSGGSRPASQTMLPGQSPPFKVSRMAAQTVLPYGQKIASGPTFAQRVRRAVRR